MNDNANMSEQLSAYLDGELSEADARAVERAVADDPSLSAELESLRATRSLLRQVPPVRPADTFAGQVVESARRRGLLKSRGDSRGRRIGLGSGLRWWVWASAAVVLIAVGVGLMVIVPGLQRQQSRQTDLAGKTPATKPGQPPSEVTLAMGDKRDDKTNRSRPSAGHPTDESVDDSAPQADASAPAAETVSPTEPARPPAPMPEPLAILPRRSTVSAEAEPTVATESEAVPVPALFRRASANEVIWTDNLSAESRNVERLLASNAIAVVPTPDGSEVAPPEQKLLLNQAANVNDQPDLERQQAPAGGVSGQDETAQVQYVVYGTEEQLNRLREQLDRQVRARQVVSQASTGRETQLAADAEADPADRLAMMQERRGGLQDRPEQPKGQTAKPASRPRPEPDNAEEKPAEQPEAGISRARPGQHERPAGQVLLITLRHRSREAEPSTRPASRPAEE